MTKGWQMTKISTGDSAPDFTLPTGTDTPFSLSDHRGSPIVLFFYPKDDTPGCTREAIGFTEKLPKFEELGITVAGVSPDPVKKHQKFRDKHDLRVILISDEDKTALEKYGVWVEKSMYGRKYMGVERTTFLIDKQGKVVNAWHKVKVPGHVDEVLQSAEAMTP